LYYLQGVPGAPGPEGQMGAKGDMVMLHHNISVKFGLRRL